MSKINQIQIALKELEGGAFQKLAESYVYKKGYEQINSVGSLLGSNKVRQGTPDSLVCMPNGKYVFFEHTTTVEDRLFIKFNDDIDKCLDEIKTGIKKSKIQEIILCHTSRMKPAEVESLRSKCISEGINLNIYGCSEISYDLLEKHPAIAKEYLGIEVDTGQVIDLDKFLSLYDRNKLSTSLQTSFYGREDNKSEVIKQMSSHELTVISGSAGVGKSRIAVECYKELLKDNSSFKAYCIFNKGIDLFEDIKAYFSDSGDYLIFVDDANRISGFTYILQLLQECRDDQSFKVIATVRDYAAESLITSARKLATVAEVTIEPFKDDEIKELLSTTLEIHNHRYQERIIEIAEGNPRLAIMSGDVAVEQQSLHSLNDVSTLYDAYFSSIKNDLEALSNGILLKVAGIVAFYRNVDKSHIEQMHEIETIFAIDSYTFWKYSQQLHDMEVFEMYENEVVKLSDQVLATYIFHLVFIKEGDIPFGLLLDNFFPKYKQKIIDAINPIFRAFNPEVIIEHLKTPVDQFWSELKSGNENSFIQLLSSFWFMKPVDTLLYIKERIVALDYATSDQAVFQEEQNSLPEPFNILLHFKNWKDEEFIISVELLLNLAEKQPVNTGKVIYCFTHYYGFEPESESYNYRLQKLAIEVLINKMEGGSNLYFSKLFLAVATEYLKTHFSSTKAGRGHTFIIQQFDLNESEPLRELRSLIITKALELHGNSALKDSVTKFLFQFSQSWHHGAVSKIIENDSELLIEFFQRYFTQDKLLHCIIVHNYTSRLRNYKIDYSCELDSSFKNKIYELYALIVKEHINAEIRLGYEKYQAARSHRIIEYIKEFQFNDYILFFEELVSIQKYNKENRNDWLIDNGLIALFQGLVNKDIGLFNLVIVDFLPFVDDLKVSPHKLVEFMLSAMDKYSVNSLINSAGFKRKFLWLSAFYTELIPDKIVEKDLIELEAHYLTAPIDSFYVGLTYLLNYETKEAGFFKKILNILLLRADTESRIAQPLRSIFSEINNDKNKLYKLISDDIELLQQVYIAASKAESHFDYNGKEFSKLLDEVPLFMARYLSETESEKRQLEDTRDYSFIWLRDDCINLMEQVDEFFLLNEQKYGFYREYQNFYQRRQHPTKDEVIIARQDKYINQKIKEHCLNKEYMSMLFHFIHELQNERKPQFFKTFLAVNKSFESFKALEVVSYSTSWSGSKIPLLNARIKHLEKIASFCDTVELLEQRSYLNQRIEYEREDIKIRKKKEYMDEDYF